MNIYLACTVRGDRGAISVTRALADAIECMGHTVLTRHLLADDPDADEGRLSEREVYERDLKWLNVADVLIAEASGSSYGVGFEVGYVLGAFGAHATARPAAVRRRAAFPGVPAHRRQHASCVHDLSVS